MCVCAFICKYECMHVIVFVPHPLPALTSGHVVGGWAAAGGKPHDTAEPQTAHRCAIEKKKYRV